MFLLSNFNRFDKIIHCKNTRRKGKRQEGLQSYSNSARCFAAPKGTKVSRAGAHIDK